MGITSIQIAKCYEIAKKVYNSEGSISKAEAIKELADKYSMNKSSSTTYIRAFEHLITGKEFKRTLNADSFDYFLRNIYKDYGSSKLKMALSSLHKHILYFEEVQNTNMIGVRKIYESYFGKIPKFPVDIFEQEEIEAIMLQSFSRDRIIEDLKNLRETDPELVEICRRIYKRDNKTIVQIKILREYKCQICGHEIITKEGKKYIEAAHIKPKRNAGPERPENILILCPNHHKEFDFGNLNIIEHKDSYVEFSLNDLHYKIDLSID